MSPIKNIFYTLIFLLFIAVPSFAGQVFYQNFDSQNYTGLSCWYGTSQTACVAGKYGWDTGYGGTGYAFKKSDSLDPDARLGYYPGDQWSSDVMYFFARFKFTEFTDTFAADGTINNYKLLYIHFEGTSSYLAPATIYSSPSSMYYSSMDSRTALSTCDTGFSSVYQSFGTNIADGNWHVIETYIKFSTGETKQWIDGSLRINDDYDFNCSDGWVNTLHDITFPDQDATTNNPDTTLLVDDWVLWDSAPSNMGSGNFPETGTGDQTPPYIGTKNPSSGQTGVDADTDVSFVIADSAGNLSTTASDHDWNWTIVGASSGSSGTLYANSTNVTCSGNNYSQTCTKTSNSFTNGEVVTVTINGEDTEANTMSEVQYTFTITSGSSTIYITSPSTGSLLSSPTSRTVEFSGTCSGAGPFSYSCPDCTVTSGSITCTDSAWSQSAEIATDGYGQNILSNSEFDNDASWYYDGDWAISSGVMSDTGSNSQYGFQQAVSVNLNEHYTSCLDVSAYTDGTPYYSQWGLTGSEDDKTASVNATGTFCTDLRVYYPDRPYRVVGNPAFTGEITAITLRQTGAMTTFSVSATGGNTDSIDISHYTSGSTKSYVYSKYPIGTDITLDTIIQFIVANSVETITSGSIDVDINGAEYACTDETVDCAAYSGDYGNGYTVTITPSTNLLPSTNYTVTIDADYLTQDSFSFRSKIVGITSGGTGSITSGGTGSITD